MSETSKFGLTISAMFACAAVIVFWLHWLHRREQQAAQRLELERWRVFWEQYRRWLAEFPDVAITLDNLAAEVRGEQLDACYPPGPEGPWPVDGLRHTLRRRSVTSQATA